MTTSPQKVFYKHITRLIYDSLSFGGLEMCFDGAVLERCDKFVPQTFKITTYPQGICINIQAGPKKNPLKKRSTCYLYYIKWTFLVSSAVA